MRTKKIRLDCFEDKYEGFIVVRRMSHEELNQIRDEFGLFDDRKERTTKENYDFMVKAFSKAKSFLVSAEIKRLEDSSVLGLEDLEYETELNNFQSELATSFLGGWAMGNANGQQ